MSDVIQKWLDSVFFTKKFNEGLVSTDFNIEDGMNINEYWLYELESANNFSKIFDINDKLSYEVVHSQYLDIDRVLKVIFVFNEFNKLVFKMTICTNSNNTLLKSNNYATQIVPKFKINEALNNCSLSLAIKSKYPISSIVSPDIELIDFFEGINFNSDGFYSVELGEVSDTKSKVIRLFLKFENSLSEKRTIFIDELNPLNVPYLIDNDGSFYLCDEKYPVNLAVWYTNGSTKNIVYPRNISLQTANIQQIIVTDVLDNDWKLVFK